MKETNIPKYTNLMIEVPSNVNTGNVDASK
jgi:hypothetical protein